MTRNEPAQAPSWGCRTDDILIAHAVFRRLFGLLPDAIRATPAYDRRGARRIAARIRMAAGGLHHHHSTEDEMLWDRLEDRAPACAFHVGLMRAQHGRIADELAVVDELTSWWVVDGDPTVRDRLASRLDEASAALRVHLRDEERAILPVVSTVMSQLEWDAVGAKARAGTDPRHAFAMFGLMLDEADPTQRAEFESHVPRIARVLYDLFGHLQYDRLIEDLIATSPRRPAMPGPGRPGSALPASS